MDRASLVGRRLATGLAPLIHDLCCCQIKCSCPWFALWYPGRGEGPARCLMMGFALRVVCSLRAPIPVFPLSLQDESTHVCSICASVPSSQVLQLSQLPWEREGSEPWGPMHGPTAAPLLLCWLWGGQLLTPEQEGVSDGSAQLSPLSQHPTTHPSIAQLFFPQGLFVLGHSPRRHRRRAQLTGRFTLPLLSGSGPGGPSSGSGGNGL